LRLATPPSIPYNFTMLGRKLGLFIGVIIVATLGWSRLGTQNEHNNTVLPRDSKRRPAQVKSQAERIAPPAVQISETDILVSSASIRLEDLPEKGSIPPSSHLTEDQIVEALRFVEVNDQAITPDETWRREHETDDGAFQVHYVGPDGTAIRQWYRPGSDLSIQETTFADQSKFTTWYSHETDDGPQKMVEYHSGTQGWQISYVNGYPKRIRFWSGDAPESVHEF